MYDYIIIGAGSAGCLLANRLSEDPKTRVLLLEAGGSDRTLNVQVPAAFSKLFKTERDWSFHSAEEPSAGNRKLYIPRGKTLGGSSSINAMIYIRGNAFDFDSWAAEGCDGWSYQDVLPHFLQVEDQERGASPHHAVGGPLRVSDLRHTNVLSQRFIDAAVASGIPANDDFNGPLQEGAGFYQVTQKDGRRWSAADAFLRPALKRPNLTVRTGAHCTRILFTWQKALGVEYRHKGRLVESYVQQEVILSAGAIQSPQLLMLSGVGSAHKLERLGIDVVADLPAVGENLQDHPLTGVTFRATEPITLDQAENISNTARYLLQKSGPLTSNVAEAGAFWRSSADEPAPDMQLHFAPAFFVEHGFANPEGCGFGIGPTLVAPEARGSVTLRTADPFEEPCIQGNHLSERRDIERLIDGIQLARDIAHQPAFDGLRGEEVLPGSTLDSRAEIEHFIRSQAELIYHPVGTCKMGNNGDSVVDPSLCVHGLEGLRVVDASIMPTIVRGNTNAATYMIASKAAEEILG